ncbi:hypothetical protein FHS89_001049 [Rubricella aquisinus]|uniref:Uncharacterized protein n=1 Tax=Rubricella aquisinus TaxID=2028108 RepID=A0A840WIW0_9RHOB|nr:hypothetical protein [Rubricella aquisinus]MBB5515039.1 hypothetical protein [Rubricella aquisinus]
MVRRGWHIERDTRTLTLSRAGRAGFDVSASTRLPFGPVSRARLAHQIRQDMWRSLRHITGFSPVVRIERDGPMLTLTAGGEISRKPFPHAQIEARIASLLTDPAHLRRWRACARVREVENA